MGFLEHVGVRVDDDASRVTTEDTAENASGGVHGGLIATLLDSAMGRAVRAVIDDDAAAVTVQLSVTYLNGGHLGDELEASAEVLKQSSSLCLVTGTVRRAGSTAEEDLIAQGQATFAVVSKESRS